MASYTFHIPGRLPGLNDVVPKMDRGFRARAYAKEKRAWTETVALLAKANKIPTLSRVRVGCIWRETNRKRDPDNVASAKKHIMDGLVLAGVLGNDGWKNIAGFSDDFEIGGAIGVEVTLTETP